MSRNRMRLLFVGLYLGNRLYKFNCLITVKNYLRSLVFSLFFILISTQAYYIYKDGNILLVNMSIAVMYLLHIYLCSVHFLSNFTL